ncbi:TonB-dependent receptor plug domain-containing protein [Pseudoalteromonas mariniglutinosa]|uniref:TonB-dependent receptor plug domain-containing protein n=1 Tax=Pseudoalteromonas mariniglutinosa TaxID=206042 RepID=UPI00384E195C
MILKRTSLLVIGIASISVQAVSVVDNNDLFSMSFEQLLDVRVEIASKTNETLASVPSTMTVFNRNEIDSLGVDNAYELMNFVPGMQSTRGDWVGAVPKDHARGIYLDSGNILVMINGERLNDASFGKASVYVPYIPISIINKVEFIRGPGSALYGSNAFLGVMNIVTMQQSNEVHFAAGNNGQQSLSLSLSGQLASDINGFLSFAYDHKNGETYPQGVKDPLSSVYFEAGLDIQRLKLRTRFNQAKLDDFVNLGGYSDNNKHHSDNGFVGIHYSWFDNNTTQLTSSLGYTQHNIDSVGLIASGVPFSASEADFLNGPAWQTTDTQFKTEFNRVLSHDWQLALGVEYLAAKQSKADVNTNHYDFASQQVSFSNDNYLQNVITIKDYPGFASLKQSFETSSAYGQLKIPYSEEITLFIGGRYDYVDGIDNKFSPRLAGIYHYDQNQTFKLQYGESFRTPVTNELFSNDDVTIGNSALKSEYVKTTELVWHYQAKQWQSNMVFFYNQLHDFIDVVEHSEDGALFTFANSINTEQSGLEWSNQWQLNEQANLAATYTHYFQQPMDISFKRFASVIARYQLNDRWQVNFNTIWRDTVQATLNNGELFKQSAYWLFGGSVSWQLTTASQLILKAENIFAKQYQVYEPRLINGAIAGTTDEFSLHYRIKF